MDEEGEESEYMSWVPGMSWMSICRAETVEEATVWREAVAEHSVRFW